MPDKNPDEQDFLDKVEDLIDTARSEGPIDMSNEEHIVRGDE